VSEWLFISGGAVVFCSFVVLVRVWFTYFGYLFEFKFYLGGVLIAICVVCYLMDLWMI
jgi:hypothetical protein